MKRILALAILALVAAAGIHAQSTTSFTITVVAPPACTVTLAANPVSPSGTQLRAGVAGVVNFNISACPIASATATATWDGTATPTTFVASQAALSVTITAAQAVAGSHALVLTIPFPALTMNSPVTLPNATAGAAYSANLGQLAQVAGGLPPYSYSLSSGSLPAGLSLSSNGIVTGTPSGAGSSSFGFTVTDSSGLALLVKSPRFVFA